MTDRPPLIRRALELLIRVLVVAGLIVDAVVHFQLADTMQLAAPDGVGGGALFRAQATVASVAAVVLLVTGHRFAYVLAAAAALSALVPVLLYAYVQVPAIGPIPSLYDPGWYSSKTASAIAEAAAVLLAVVGFVLTSRTHGRRSR